MKTFAKLCRTHKNKKTISLILTFLFAWLNLGSCLLVQAQGTAQQPDWQNAPATRNSTRSVNGSPPYGSTVRKSLKSPYSKTASRKQELYADDTIIIYTRPNADKDKINELLDEVHGTILKTLHLNAANFDIFFVKPESCTPEELIRKLTDKDKKEKNFKRISRNHLGHISQSQPTSNPPNDPCYTSQSTE